MKIHYSQGRKLAGLFGPKCMSQAKAAVLVVLIVLLLGMVWKKMAEQAMQWSSSHRLAGDSNAPRYGDERRRSEVKQRFDQGVAMLQLGQYEYAVTAFHRVLALNPKIPEAHVNMGFAFYELGDFAGAERFFQGALALAPGLKNAQYGLAIALFAQGDRVAALSAIRHYVDSTDERDPFHAKGLSKLREIELALRATQHMVSPTNRGEESATTAPTTKAP